MLGTPRKYTNIAVIVIIFICVFYTLDWRRRVEHVTLWQQLNSTWAKVPENYPPSSLQRLPTGRPVRIPQIQHTFLREKIEAKNIRQERLGAVRESFAHAWNGYKEHAWLKDEVAPLSGGHHDAFGGWAATLVDSLDTLWIMGFREDFDHAVDAVATINFESSTSQTLSLFETTIRYLGGLLSAYDLSGKEVLLRKAVELGETLYRAFDTPNRMPVAFWDWQNAMDGGAQKAAGDTGIADIGSLSMEFTRLSQLSGDAKYFDAVQHITDLFAGQQNQTSLRGMWPVHVNPQVADFHTGNDYSLGAMSDSFYEYLPKQYMLLGGLRPEYRHMYEAAIEAARDHLFVRPMNLENKEMLLPGNVRIIDGNKALSTSSEHLACFVSGMVGIGAKIFERDDDMPIAQKLVDGITWAYQSFPSGIMPEVFDVVPCPSTGNCDWDQSKWHEAVSAHGEGYGDTAEEIVKNRRLPPGFSNVAAGKYILRPEAIESVFIMYRITGDTTLQDKAWAMFQAIEKHTRTEIAHAALKDVTVEVPEKEDKMESFWTAETLKYFYLIFCEPDIISLDEYVFNTEAHPFKRSKPRRWGWGG